MWRLAAKLVAGTLLGVLIAAAQTPPAKTAPQRRKSTGTVKQTPPPPPAAIPQMTPEQLPAQPPRVSYQNGRLAVDSQNSTLGDVLTAIRRQTGAQLDLPPGVGSERVAAHLAGPPREVITSLLDGSNLGYIILGSPENPDSLQKVILTVLPKSAPTPSAATASNRPAPTPQAFQPPANDFTGDDDQPDAVTDRNPMPPDQNAPVPPGVPPGVAGQPPQMVPGQPVPSPDGNQNPYVGGEQPRFGQPVQMPPGANQQQNPGQPQVKTPDQLLQELQRMRNRQQNPDQQ
jgi:hypothetical protein